VNYYLKTGKHKTKMTEADNLILDGHKLSWHGERVKRWQDGERIAPVTIDCSLTQACTYKCVYCYGQLQQNKGKQFSADIISRFLDDCAEIGVKAISFVSDGESTCSPHLYDAILKGKQNGLDMALGTNGYLLKDERLLEILPALTYLRFNITAANPERYAEIHGCQRECFHKVVSTIRQCMVLKKIHNLEVTIGLQMVLMPDFKDQILPLAELGRELGVDYLVIKHCSDDENGSLGVDYNGYDQCIDLLREAENLSGDGYQVKAKWSKILSGGKRCYSRCYGPPFILQMSGSGLVAPCGMLFHEKYKKYHIGNICDMSFKEIWKSERYWRIMNLIASEKFDARIMCGTLCLQHKVNEFLWNIKESSIPLPAVENGTPAHINFI
jgi:MoaA/NifB/PqqE/SkfB family radical SAM enzyme